MQSLKRQLKSGLVAAWRYKMRAAKGREKVVKRDPVRDIKHGEVNANRKALNFAQVVFSNSDIEKRARRDTHRVSVIILSAKRWYSDTSSAELRFAALTNRVCGCSVVLAAAETHL
jgi:hypothetical protein